MPFCIPISSVWEFLLLHICSDNDVVSLPDFSHSNKSVMVSHFFSFLMRMIVPELTSVAVFLYSFPWDAATVWLDERCVSLHRGSNPWTMGHRSAVCKLDHYATRPALCRCFFNLNFPDDIRYGLSFHMLPAIGISSLGRCLLRYLAHFFIR